MNAGWKQISDSELRTKLEQRGITGWYAKKLVSRRDRDLAADTIDRILGVER